MDVNVVLVARADLGLYGLDHRGEPPHIARVERASRCNRMGASACAFTNSRNIAYVAERCKGANGERKLYTLDFLGLVLSGVGNQGGG